MGLASRGTLWYSFPVGAARPPGPAPRDKEHEMATTKTTKTAKMATCECGCGAATNPGRRFRIGHDAKLKSVLINTALGADKAKAKGAEARILALGWEGHLAISRAMRERKAARKGTATRPVAPAPRARKAPVAKPVPAGEAAVGDGRVPASVMKLGG